MDLAYIIPTRDRPHILRQTINALGALPPHSAQVIVVDNASAAPPEIPNRLDNGLTVELIRHRTNLGAAARNTGVAAADPCCDWVVMLDDDSSPLNTNHLRALREAPRDVAAVAAEIFLDRAHAAAPRSHPPRESGGLPEIFIGCGVAIRREAFLDSGGYDHTFGFYAEEYDLAAKFIINGLRITLDRRFAVEHRKVSSGRDMNLIMQRLVRNNGWVMQRYAPTNRRTGELRHVIERYALIARKEQAEPGYTLGLQELLTTLRSQHRTPMDTTLWDRFTGKAAARASLQRAFARQAFTTAAIIDEGKNSGVIREVLGELGVREVAHADTAEALIIGTLSPGPMLDACDRHARDQERIICGWDELANQAVNPTTSASRAA